MRTAAVLPVKRFALAKQRLAAALPVEARRTLAEAMVRDVLDALAAVPEIDVVVVVTAEEVAARAARDAVRADAHVVVKVRRVAVERRREVRREAQTEHVWVRQATYTSGTRRARAPRRSRARSAAWSRSAACG